jgi:acyl carrier protein
MSLMNRDQCVEIISGAYQQFVPAEQRPSLLTDETRLFGGDSPLDSAALVSLVVEVEQQISENCEKNIVIADDRAMSQRRSPFRSIGSLADYIQMVLNEKND